MAYHTQARSSTDILREALLIKDMIDNLRDEGVIYLSHKLNITHKDAAELMLKHAGVTKGQLGLARRMIDQQADQMASAATRLRGKSANSFAELAAASTTSATLTMAEAIFKVSGRLPGISGYEAIRLAQPQFNWTSRNNAFTRLMRAPCKSIWGALLNHQRPGRAQELKGPNLQYDHVLGSFSPSCSDKPKHRALNPHDHGTAAHAHGTAAITLAA